MDYLDQIRSLLVEAQDIAKNKLGVNNLYYNESFIEIIAASLLNHKYNNHTQGADAFEEDGTPTDYKAINLLGKTKNPTFQFHWLSDNKVEKLKETNNIYFIVRKGVNIEEIYRVSTQDLISQIEEKGTKNKKTDGHTSFSLKQIKRFPSVKKVYNI